MNLRVFVTTCDKYLWAMRPFAYLFNIFWSSLQTVIVLGYQEPDFALPPNFEFVSCGQDGGQEHWTDGVIQALRDVNDDLLVLLLEDYWLTRKVDNAGVNTLADYMLMHPEILRVDLTTDRMYNGKVFDLEAFGHYDLVETPYKAEYQMSLQAGIWRRKLFLELLKPGMSPWRVEMDTQPPEHMRVVGTKQSPVKYANAFKGGDVGTILNLGQIPKEHVEYMRGQGWLD